MKVLCERAEFIPRYLIDDITSKYKILAIVYEGIWVTFHDPLTTFEGSYDECIKYLEGKQDMDGVSIKILTDTVLINCMEIDGYPPSYVACWIEQ